MRRDPRRALEWTKVYPAQRSSIANLSRADAGRLFLLILYCAEKVNGGVIEGARNWTRKQWKNETLLDEILSKNQPNFWHFSGENLIVDAYDAEAENATISKRKDGIEGREKQLKNSGYPAGDTDKDTDKDKTIFDDDDDTGQARRAKNLFEVEEFLRSHEKHMSREQVDACAADFWRMNEERGWTDSNGEPLRNWQGAARGYADKWRQRLRTQRDGGGTAARREEKGTDPDPIDDFFTN